MANPAATSTTARTRDVIVRALGSDLKIEVAVTDRRGHAAELATAARADGVDVVIALGGDGTVNEVVNGLLAGSDGRSVCDGPALAVVPGGSTNVFARALDIAPDPVEATGQILDALREGRRRRITLGRVDDRWFTFTAGFGLDAQVVARVERERARGHISTPRLYLRAAATELYRSHQHPSPMRLERPGEEPIEGLHMIVVANTRPWTYLSGRAIDPSPSASFDSGLDVFALRSLAPLSVLRTATQLLAGRGAPHGPGVLTLGDLDELTVVAAPHTDIEVDGDHLGTRTRVRLVAVREALSVVA